jgi:two-component system nitrogen regulation sensor histidine kinase NtrY
LRRLAFRGRLFLFLLIFALVPTVILTLTLTAMGSWQSALIGNRNAWEDVSASGTQAIAGARRAPLDSAAAAALATHERGLSDNMIRSRQATYIYGKAPGVVVTVAIIALAIVGVLASSAAGHLSRALGRPLLELVGWTAIIGRGEELPAGPPRRGAPEFELLRARMREMAGELKLGRARALEAERAAALRESARQVAHELKNPLTPIRFAVERLRKEAPASLQGDVEVLAVESARLESLAKSFAQFGRLPEGPRAPVDVGELVRYAARAAAPPHIEVEVDVADHLPLVDGHYDALARALGNVMLNAVDACGASGTLTVRVARTTLGGADAVALSVQDTGHGIAADALPRIWDPYVTTKPGGTGLGLAIVRQTILAHGGEVSAESVPGAGTTIRFVLPVRVADRADSAGAMP